MAAERRGDCGVIDLEAGEIVAKLSSGTTGTKVAKGAGTAASAVGAFFLSLISLGAETSALVYQPGPARPSISLTRDATRLLVLNQRTDDVTVFDTVDLSVKNRFVTGEGSHALIPSPVGDHFYVPAFHDLTVIDSIHGEMSAKTHSIEEEGKIVTVFVDEKRNEIWVPRKSATVVFDLITGEDKASVHSLPRPITVVSYEGQ